MAPETNTRRRSPIDVFRYLDYRTFLHEIRLLNPEIPVLLEHLPNADEYVLAADYIRSVAAEA